MEKIKQRLHYEEKVAARALVLFEEHRLQINKNTDRLFAWLMIFQWIAGIAAAIWISPRTWSGQFSQVHLHVYAAVFLGGAITFLPAILGFVRSGETSTRYVIAVSQMLMSALLIHLSGGRIETHFHVFGSLAFLAFYRDWKVLIPATLIVAFDHWLRGAYWPQSVYGTLVVSYWRWLEHAGWVVFEDVFLIMSCLQGVKEMHSIAQRTAELEMTNQVIEAKVQERTQELITAKESLEDEIEGRKKLEGMVIQSEKMAAVGQLAAGIAHEINNPVGFIGNNLSVLSKYTVSFRVLLDKAKALQEAVMQKDNAAAGRLIEEITSLESKLNLEYIRGDVDPLLSESQEGIERIKKIVNDLRTFARSDSESRENADLNQIIDRAANIVWNEIKYKAQLQKSYDSSLPLISCDTQQIGQVVVNLLINAIQAIPDKGVISIRTYEQNGWVCADIKDTGTGIQPEILSKIFNPFFTTKEAGKGTGLGLSISHEIMKKYAGKIEVQSEPGRGSLFTLSFPAAASKPFSLTAST